MRCNIWDAYMGTAIPRMTTAVPFATCAARCSMHDSTCRRATMHHKVHAANKDCKALSNCHDPGKMTFRHKLVQEQLEACLVGSSP